jgi:hypothetical protein
VAAIRRPAIGQRMLAVRSNERAAAAAGIDVRRVKLTAFMVSALIAAVCGALYAYNFETVSSDLFGSVNALVIIAYAYFGGITMISGALFAGLGATQGLIPQAFDTWWGAQWHLGPADRRDRPAGHARRQPGRHRGHRVLEAPGGQNARFRNARRGGDHRTSRACGNAITRR